MFYVLRHGHLDLRGARARARAHAHVTRWRPCTFARRARACDRDRSSSRSMYMYACCACGRRSVAIAIARAIAIRITCTCMRISCRRNLGLEISGVGVCCGRIQSARGVCVVGACMHACAHLYPMARDVGLGSENACAYQSRQPLRTLEYTRSHKRLRGRRR